MEKTPFSLGQSGITNVGIERYLPYSARNRLAYSLETTFVLVGSI
jgi:hypothetical protein